MWNFPLHPPADSPLATRVDILFYAWLGIAGVVTLVIFILIVYFCVKYRHGSPADRRMESGRATAPRQPPDRDRLDRDAAAALRRDVRLGSRPVLRPCRAARQRDRGLRRRQAMDVEARASGGPARDRRAARARGAAGQARHDVAGRDPQLLHAGVPDQAGRAARPLHDAVVHGDEARRLPRLLLAVLRHRSRADDRPRRRHGASRVSRAGFRAATHRSRWRRRARRAFASTAAAAAMARTRRCTRPGSKASSAGRVQLSDGIERGRRRALHPRLGDAAAQAGRRRLRADHAVVPGPDRRGRPARHHRVHQVAAGCSSGRRSDEHACAAVARELSRQRIHASGRGFRASITSGSPCCTRSRSRCSSSSAAPPRR